MELSLATIDELFDELEKRFDACVFHGRRAVNRDDSTYSYRRFQHGEIEECTFLLSEHQYLLHQEYLDTRRDPEPWEEL